MNNTQNGYTLGRFRHEVFRALDEYSCNGEEHELFSGGTGDIDKRFISALNSAIRLVYLASARRPVQAHINFRRPDVAAEYDSFVIESGKTAEFPVSDCGALSFWFCGKGKVCVYDGDLLIVEKSFESQCANFECFKMVKIFSSTKLVIAADKQTEIRQLRTYAAWYRDYDEEYIPDGKNVYCAISPDCVEICGITRHVGGRDELCPTDIFTLCNGALYCDEKYCGEYTVDYYRYPAEFSENDSPDTPVELPPAACSAAVYAAAAELCAREDGELYTRLMYKYREILANTYPAGNLRRKNSFFAGGLFGRRKPFGVFRG